jgi:hypothetical protein
MSDGKILRNQGDGWKLFRSVKPGIDPVQHFAAKVEARKARELECPAWAAYIKGLCNTVSLSKRWMLHAAIQMLGNDIDGIWSEMDMHGESLDLEELQALAENFELGQAELKAWKAKHPTPATVNA